MLCPECNEKRTHETIQCSGCLRWYHFTCLNVQLQLKLIPYLHNYIYYCISCTQKSQGPEAKSASFTLSKPSWRDSIVTALANLTLIKKRKYFHTTADITPFIQENWEVICYQRPHPTHAIKSSVGARLYSTLKDFDPLGAKRCAIGYYCLKHKLYTLHPHSTPSVGDLNLETIELLDAKYESDSLFDYSKMQADDAANSSPSTKRKAIKANDSEEGPRPNKRGRPLGSGEPAVEKPQLIGNEHPFDRDGYIYTHCEKDPLLSSVYRLTYPIDGVILSAEHSSPCIQIDKMTHCFSINNQKKYRSVKASHGASYGSFYFEILQSNKRGNFRVGVAEMQGKSILFYLINLSHSSGSCWL